MSKYVCCIDDKYSVVTPTGRTAIKKECSMNHEVGGRPRRVPIYAGSTLRGVKVLGISGSVYRWVEEGNLMKVQGHRE